MINLVYSFDGQYHNATEEEHTVYSRYFVSNLSTASNE